MTDGSITIARRPFIIVVSGPSGVGKSTIVERLLERCDDISPSVSMTTREPRPGEREGVDYFFVTQSEFARRRDAGELLEWATVHGNLYGTPGRHVDERIGYGQRVLLEIDVQGGMTVKEKRPDAVLVFLLPPSLEELERRLRGRGTDDEAVVRRRLKNARWELGFYDTYDYLVVNDEIGPCVDDALCIIRSESLRHGRSRVTIAGSVPGSPETT
jgi:guanylate kinase